MGQGRFSHVQTVRFPDVDHAGIAFFGALQVYCHYAHEEWLKMLGFPLHVLLTERDLAFPLVHLESDFKSPARHGDTLRIEVRLERLGRRSMTLGYTLHNETTGQLSGTTRITQVCVHARAMQSMEIPEDFRAALRVWEGGEGGVG